MLSRFNYVRLFATPWTIYSPPGSFIHEDSPGKNTEVGCHALLQGIFPTQGSNLGLLHCRRILYHLSHQGSPWILEWVAYPFPRGSSWPRKPKKPLRCFILGEVKVKSLIVFNSPWVWNLLGLKISLNSQFKHAVLLFYSLPGFLPVGWSTIHA